MIKQFSKLLIIASALSFAAMPVSFAGEKAAKTPSCKEEAKAAGVKKEDMKKYVKECKEKRKAAAGKKCGGEGKK